MFVETRRHKDKETITYSIRYYDDSGKLRRLKTTAHPVFKSLEDAKSWAKSQEAITASRKSYILKKMEWKTKFYNFEKLLETFKSYQQKNAPNSWKSSVQYLEQWVFTFFLQEMQMGNVNDWHMRFQEFTDWLSHNDAGRRKGKKQPLAVSTKNNIIKALNVFLTCLSKYNLIDKDSVKKCTAFPEHLVNHRTYKDVILEDEMRRVYNVMTSINRSAAEFFIALWCTGMRFSELYGLPITAMVKGQIPDKSLHDELTLHRITYIGYLYLESQPFHDTCQREPDKSLKRKPLKSCKSIDPRYARIIPIRTKEVWNILALRHKQGLERFMRKEFTTSKEDYRLFEDLKYDDSVRTFKAAYSKLKIDAKQFHCCRHTFVTLLVGETRSFFLTRAITGHRKDKSFERYLHIFERMNLAAKQEDQTIDVV